MRGGSEDSGAPGRGGRRAAVVVVSGAADAQRRPQRAAREIAGRVLLLVVPLRPIHPQSPPLD